MVSPKASMLISITCWQVDTYFWVVSSWWLDVDLRIDTKRYVFKICLPFKGQSSTWLGETYMINQWERMSSLWWWKCYSYELQKLWGNWLWTQFEFATLSACFMSYKWVGVELLCVYIYNPFTLDVGRCVNGLCKNIPIKIFLARLIIFQRTPTFEWCVHGVDLVSIRTNNQITCILQISENVLQHFVN